MPYTITNTGKVDSLQIQKISLSTYANLVNSNSLNPNIIYIVEAFGGGSVSSNGDYNFTMDFQK